MRLRVAGKVEDLIKEGISDRGRGVRTGDKKQRMSHTCTHAAADGRGHDVPDSYAITRLHVTQYI